jgi:hypothetical protein
MTRTRLLDDLRHIPELLQHVKALFFLALQSHLTRCIIHVFIWQLVSAQKGVIIRILTKTIKWAPCILL